MGWMVEVLLRNREYIRSRATSLQSSQDMYNYPAIYDTVSLDELEESYDELGSKFPSPTGGRLDTYDQFNDLLLVENKIKEMYSKGLLSDMDIRIIDCLGDGKLLSDAEEFLNLGRYTIALRFISICKRIAYFLGGYFTDEGLIDKVTKDNNLTEEQTEKLKEFISGNSKYQIIRKPKTNENNQ